MEENVHRFYSSVLGNERDVWIRVPADLNAFTKVLFVLDAELYRNKIGAHKIFEELVDRSLVPDSMVIYVSCCDMEVRWKECPCYPPFATFIVEELYPWLVERFPSIERCESRVIAGLSYTALAASYVALESKGLFGKVIAQSGAYWSNDCWLIQEYKRRTDGLDIAFYLDIGHREIQTMIQHRAGHLQRISQTEGVKRFRKTLLDRGNEVRYEVFKGGHSCECWTRTLPIALEWALGDNPSNTMDLRPLSSEDATTFRSLVGGRNRRFNLDKVTPLGGTKHYGAFVEGLLVSCVSLWANGSYVCVLSYLTLEAYRSKGIGTELLAHAVVDL